MTPEDLEQLLEDRESREDARPDGIAFVLVMKGVNLLGVRGELLSATDRGNNVGFTYKQVPRMLKRLRKEMADV
jgi:hypothetical protein